MIVETRSINKNDQFSPLGMNGTKKVNDFKDGFLILKEMIYLFFNHNR